MTTREYQDLYSLMLDGAVARSSRGDVAALSVPAEVVAGLRTALRPGELDRLLDAIERDRLEHEAASALAGADLFPETVPMRMPA